MVATIFFYILCTFFFFCSENLTVNRAHPCSAQTLWLKTFLENQGLRDKDQYNKIIEDTEILRG
jgi:hypothetical protein